MKYKTTLTICPYCGCGCAISLESIEGRLVGTAPSPTSPVNQRKLCVKGWSAHEFVQHPRRLKKPLLKKNNVFTEVSWEEALDFAASRLREIKQAAGPEAIAFQTSAKLTNEENYLIQKFARAAVGTNNVDHCARL